MSLLPMLRALGHRNYRLYFIGQGVSLIGTWMQQVAAAWLVFELTHSSWWLGVVNFAGQMPAFFVAPFAGVLVDRWNRHRLLILTQTLMMLQAFALAALALTHVIHVWHLLALSALLGLVNAFDMTGRQAFLTQIVARREDLANAIALNSSMVNGTRLVGPALAGVVLAGAGAGVCFLVNGISYLAVLAALLAMCVTQAERKAPHPPLVQGLREGFAYAFGFPPIRALLLLLAAASLMGFSYAVLLPVFATDVLHGGARMLGVLTAASGVGALLAAMWLAARKTVLGLGRVIAVAPAAAGLGLIAFSFSQWWWLSAPLLSVTGFALMAQMASSNTILQTIVDEDKRGRVMSLYTMAFLGMSPLGSLLIGWLADVLGAPAALLISGVSCVLASLAFAPYLPSLRARVRPIYTRLGILPQAAAGVQAATELTTPPEEE
ncbi:MAG TPA: MFS transporter [Gemmataceae bacterium]|nr:MFS transporter [Gemmataceae bacterium]